MSRHFLHKHDSKTILEWFLQCIGALVVCNCIDFNRWIWDNFLHSHDSKTLPDRFIQWIGPIVDRNFIGVSRWMCRPYQQKSYSKTVEVRFVHCTVPIVDPYCIHFYRSICRNSHNKLDPITEQELFFLCIATIFERTSINFNIWLMWLYQQKFECKSYIVVCFVVLSTYSPAIEASSKAECGDIIGSNFLRNLDFGTTFVGLYI